MKQSRPRSPQHPSNSGQRPPADCLIGEPWSRRKFLGGLAAWAVAMRGVAPLGAAVGGSTTTAPGQELLAYYAKPAAVDDGGAHRAFLAGLPSGLEALVSAIQGLVLHQFWAPAYGETLTAARHQEPHLRGVQDMLACLHDRTPLADAGARAPSARLVGVCRHFTLLMVAALRAHGIPARARCGFANYFARGKFEDHWVAECWSGRETRWRLVDAQLDGLQRNKLGVDFDPLDVPRDRFVVGGRAWQMCRRGEASPEQFGLSFLKEYGIWFVANNLVRDLAALNKVEMLPWDVWGAMMAPGGAIAPATETAFDEVAHYSLEPDGHFGALRERYRTDARFTVPPAVTNAIRGTTENIPVIQE
ncbi:MAG TPA: transglutaminase-like domain-containing protein [Lacunisphaera sp.]|nr:transglutaminase-like domain-containing protein [Lacunisphaera sp.]